MIDIKHELEQDSDVRASVNVGGDVVKGFVTRIHPSGAIEVEWMDCRGADCNALVTSEYILDVWLEDL